MVQCAKVGGIYRGFVGVHAGCTFNEFSKEDTFLTPLTTRAKVKGSTWGPFQFDDAESVPCESLRVRGESSEIAGIEESRLDFGKGTANGTPWFSSGHI